MFCVFKTNCETKAKDFKIIEFLQVSSSSETSKRQNKNLVFKSLEVFYKKDVLKNFAKFTRKHLCLSLFFNKVAAFILQPSGCFPENFAKFLRPILKNICERLLLNFVYHTFHLATSLTSFMTRAVSYRNQSIDLQCKSIDWFLYNNGLRHERVKLVFSTSLLSHVCLIFCHQT